MGFLKYVIAVIAIFSTLMFISNIISNLVNSHVIVNNNDTSGNDAAFRLIAGLIMSITWPLVFML